MKNSTILIIVGIAIAVLGIGIAIMNTAQTDDKPAVSTVSGIERTSQMLEKKIHQQGNSGTMIPSVPTPMIIIIFGMVVLAAGVYDSRHTPSIGNVQRPGTI